MVAGSMSAAHQTAHAYSCSSSPRRSLRTILPASGSGMTVATGYGSLHLVKQQPENGWGVSGEGLTTCEPVDKAPNSQPRQQVQGRRWLLRDRGR
jgi:hypothetical protein